MRFGIPLYRAICSCFFLLLTVVNRWENHDFSNKGNILQQKAARLRNYKETRDSARRGGGVVAGTVEDVQRKPWEMGGKILKNDQFITDNWTAWWNSGDDIVIRLRPSICAHINACVCICVSVIFRGFLMLSVSPFRQIGILAIPRI